MNAVIGWIEANILAREKYFRIFSRPFSSSKFVFKRKRAIVLVKSVTVWRVLTVTLTYNTTFGSNNFVGRKIPVFTSVSGLKLWLSTLTLKAFRRFQSLIQVLYCLFWVFISCLMKSKHEKMTFLGCSSNNTHSVDWNIVV